MVFAELSDEKFAQSIISEVSAAAKTQREISKALDAFLTDCDPIPGYLLGASRKDLDASILKRLDALAEQQFQGANQIDKLVDLLAVSIETRKIPNHKQLLADLRVSKIAVSLRKSSKRIQANQVFAPRIRSARLADWLELRLRRLQGKKAGDENEK